jgi:SAM-dependent methyltransferase
VIGKEIDLLVSYPKAKRNLDERAASKTEEDRAVARKFDKDFFDGDRKHGYGGYHYNPRFWQPVIPAFIEHFNLQSGSSVLDIGCGKGFMLYDMSLLIPGVKTMGIDISEYAIQNALPAVRSNVLVANATKLPFGDKAFDAVISINTIHNLELPDLKIALREIERVSKGKSFITVDAYNNDEERERMMKWNLTAKTILHANEWKSLFREVGYTGDYFWFIP